MSSIYFYYLLYLLYIYYFYFYPCYGISPALLPAAVSFSKPAHQDTIHQGAVYMLWGRFELHVKSLTRESFVRKPLVRTVSKLNLHILLLTVKRTADLYNSKKSVSTKIDPILLINGSTSFTSGFTPVTKPKRGKGGFAKAFLCNYGTAQQMYPNLTQSCLSHYKLAQSLSKSVCCRYLIRFTDIK